MDIQTRGLALGAEIVGLDWSRPLADGELDGLRKALLDHQVVYMRQVTILVYTAISCPILCPEYPDISAISVLTLGTVSALSRPRNSPEGGIFPSPDRDSFLKLADTAASLAPLQGAFLSAILDRSHKSDKSHISHAQCCRASLIPVEPFARSRR